MRIVPKQWHTETWVCSIRGHCLPAATVENLRPEDRRLGIEVDDGHRLVRCIRCDSWVELAPPHAERSTTELLPPIAELDKPRRGKVLRDAVLLRIIAIDRGIHAVVFALLAAALVAIDVRLPGLKSAAQDLEDRLSPALQNTGQQPSRDWVTRSLHKVLDVNGHTLAVLAATAIVYAVIEGVEAVGLWRERRWAEYLTVAATAGFLPFEVNELIDRTTAVRVGALVLNVAILVWLVRTKHLFGVRGGEHTLHESTDWDAILATSAPAPVAVAAPADD